MTKPPRKPRQGQTGRKTPGGETPRRVGGKGQRATAKDQVGQRQGVGKVGTGTRKVTPTKTTPTPAKKTPDRVVKDRVIPGKITGGGGKTPPISRVPPSGGKGVLSKDPKTPIKPLGGKDTVISTDTPGRLQRLSNADINALNTAFGQIQNRPYVPQVTIPDRAITIPDVVGVARPGTAPSGVTHAKDAIDTLRDDIPLLMFPVRLETRFTANTTQLRIRIFPDQASLQTLDPRLTKDEYTAGQTFLKEHKAAKTREAKLDQWRAFAATYEPRRAAHIVRAIRAGGADKTLRDPNDSHRAFAPLLPDHWLVTGYAGGRVAFDKAGNAIPTDLKFSPDFAVKTSVENDLAIDPAIRWMTDYGQALAKGMAVTVSVPPFARAKIDEIYVVGVRSKDAGGRNGKMTVTKAANTLDELFESHLLDWGAGFVPPATATNNTADVDAGWSDQAPDLDDIYVRLIEDKPKAALVANDAVGRAVDETLAPSGTLDAADTPDQSNFRRLEKALGLKVDSSLRQMENRTGAEDAVQAAMNTLLWPVTLGELFSQLLSGRETDALDDDAVNWLRGWFIHNVRGGATVPSLRLGRTPYGVLPVQKTHLTQEPAHLTGEAKKRQLLATRLRSMLRLWDAAADDVLRMGEMQSGLADQYPEPGDRFLQILRQQPNPAQFSASRALSERSLWDLRYEIRNLAVHPDHNSFLLRDIFADVEINISGFRYKGTAPGKAQYENWPNRFTSGAYQIEVLTEKRELLLDLLNANSDHYRDVVVRVAGIPFNIGPMLKAPMLARSEDIQKAADWLQEMINLCDDHADNNAKFDAAFDPPTDVFSGKVGYDSNDAPLTYLSFDGGLRDWNPATHVVVKQGTAPVSFARQVDYLHGYAQSFVSSNPAPAEPTFPGGKRPLLYRLLKEAIYRTGIDEEAISLPLFEMDEITQQSGLAQVDRQAQIGSVVGAMEAQQVTALTGGLRAITATAPNKRVATANDGLARTLRGTSAARLQSMAVSLDREIRSQRTNKSFPVAQMQALSRELKAVSANGDGALRSLRLSAVPNLRHNKITAMQAALTALRDLNPDQVELLMTQTLGLASWRLDAWLTSLPQQRITALRDGSKRHGIQIGAFGWVQNLRPNNRDSGDLNRVKSQGYIHAPSLNHAKTAAILRAGWANYGDTTATSSMAVDLRSRRMRDAQWLFAAVRRGQDLGDVLGYRFERYLKTTAKAPQWIYPVRQAVLGLTGQEIDPEQPGVDGLELNRLVERGQTKALQGAATEVLKDLGGTAKVKTWGAVEQAFDYLIGQVDALGDAALADSTHALVQGNLLRAGSSVSAISDGEVPPPELDFLHTTPSAQTQTHRLALLAPPRGQGATAWVTDPEAYPAAAADPDAEALVAGLLGSPDQLQVRVVYDDEEGIAVGETTFTWADMLDDGSPFALPALQTLQALPADIFSAHTDLGRRMLAHAAAFPPRKTPKGATPRLDMAEAARAAMEEVLDRWRAWRSVVFDARPLTDRDIVTGTEGEEMSIAAPDLEARAKAAAQRAERSIKAVLGAMPPPVEGDQTPMGKIDPTKLLALFDELARMGLTHAVYRGPVGVIDSRAIWDHAWSLAPRLRKMRKALAAVDSPKGKDVEPIVKAARARLKAVFGPKFPGTARLTSTHLSQITESFGTSQKRLALTKNGTPAQWIEKLGYVRPAFRAMNDAMLLQDCAVTEVAPIALHVAQWPEDKVQPWIAISGTEGETPPKASFIAATVGGHDAHEGEDIAGLVVDEVVDRVPAKTVNAAAALHFDAPNTEAPQTFLLALPPVGGSWDYATLVDTVRDAFHLARVRAVDGPLLSDMHQVLPAIYASKATIGGTY